jgi:hypothetical protein
MTLEGACTGPVTGEENESYLPMRTWLITHVRERIEKECHGISNN